ncbi:hypothetical protein ACSBR2_034975 [Camellia fascicularis]
MGTVQNNLLQHLSDDDCWLVFEQHAFGNRSLDANPNLVFIGRKIVGKCKGLPLVARTLGGLLRCKERDEEWEIVLNSKIWDLTGQGNEIPPALRLSYHHLPSHLKQCFAYCSIVPKDYEFEEMELVFLWMAEGLLPQQNGEKRMEDLGVEYFRELQSRSFFQPSSSGESSKFVMHDLINDLAQSVAGYTCFRLEDKLKDQEQCRKLKSARHSSYMQNNYDAIKKQQGSRIKELGNLIHLGGKLCISGIENVVDPLDARWVCLNDKQGIDVLTMVWSSESLDGLRNEMVEIEVLDILQPHKKLKELYIRGYHCLRFPIWTGDPLFSNMVCMKLQNCKNCTSLPPLGQLPSLKDLHIEGMSAVKHVGYEFYGQHCAKPFPSLETLLSHLLISSQQSLIHFLLEWTVEMRINSANLLQLPAQEHT